MSEASLRHLLGRLQVCELRVRRALADRRAARPGQDNPLLGLYLADDDVDRVLGDIPGKRIVAADPEEEALRAEVEARARSAAGAGDPTRLAALAQAFGLEELDVDLLLMALVPELDTRFEWLYGYLNDDVSRRWPTVGLALELCGASPLDGRARRRLGPAGPLVAGGLVAVEEADRPFLSRALRVPDRITAHLLGDDDPDSTLVDVLAPSPVAAVDGSVVARAVAGGASLVYLTERPGGAARSMAVDGLARAGLSALSVDLERLAQDPDPGGLVALAGREARLTGAGLVAGPVEALVPSALRALRALARLPGPVVLVGRGAWDPTWSQVVPASAAACEPDRSQRLALWQGELARTGRSVGPTGWGTGMNGAGGPAAVGQPAMVGEGPAAVAARFRLAPESVTRSVRAAVLQSGMDGSALGLSHLLAGARAQNAAGLERLARRLAPAVGWVDLILPVSVSGQLRDLAARARNRAVVLDEWRMRPGGGKGRGVTALFAGDPGTGKTMAAEVIAADLGMDLYVVNLAAVVDKYIGETEKNLERIFGEAEGVNGVILFDEADALFGKRSEVSDAQDRHANVEVAYLLQRMEAFDGLAVLATNLRANLDEAFARRLDAIVEFPLPGPEERLALWEACLGPVLPRGDDLDLGFCARAFELSGGSIRSIAVTAAYLAADGGRPVAMADLMRATEREYRKLGRLVLESEFGLWLATARG